MGKKDKKGKKTKTVEENVKQMTHKLTDIFDLATKDAKKEGEREYYFSIPGQENGCLVVKSYTAANDQLRTTWMLNGKQCPKMGVKSLLDSLGRKLGETPATRKVPDTKAAQAYRAKHGPLMISEKEEEKTEDEPTTTKELVKGKKGKKGKKEKKGKKSKKEESAFTLEQLETVVKKKDVKESLLSLYDKDTTKELLSSIFGEDKKTKLHNVIVELSEATTEDLKEMFSSLF